MQKNTSGQKIGAQMLTASDGSAFTGSVTVAVTIDAGTQATGSVGSGACTHEGNGYHTYAPAQAETNGALLAFTFTGTGAVPVTVQVFTVGYDKTAAQVPANVTQVAGTAQTARDLGASVLLSEGTGTGQVSLSSGKVLLQATQTGVTIPTVTSLTNAPTSGDFTATMKTSIGTAVAASAVASVTGNVGGNVTGSIGSLATQAKADVNAEADTAISDAALATATNLATAKTAIDGIKTVTDALPDSGALTSLATATALSTADGKIDTLTTRLGAPADFGGGQSIAENLQDMVGSPTFDASTDSLEALRNRGDSAWATADVSGLSTPSDIPSASTIAAAVLTAAESAPIEANVTAVNDVTLTGDGSATAWGPA